MGRAAEQDLALADNERNGRLFPEPSNLIGQWLFPTTMKGAGQNPKEQRVHRLRVWTPFCPNLMVNHRLIAGLARARYNRNKS